MAIAAPNTPIDRFKSAHSAYQASLLLRRCAATEEEIDATEVLIAPIYDMMVAAPACGPRAIATKARSIIDEFGGCDVPVHMVECLLRDIERLIL